MSVHLFLALVMVLGVWLYQFVHESRIGWTLKLAPVRVGVMVLMVLYLATVSSSSTQPFIYFQF